MLLGSTTAERNQRNPRPLCVYLDPVSGVAVELNAERGVARLGEVMRARQAVVTCGRRGGAWTTRRQERLCRARRDRGVRRVPESDIGKPSSGGKT